MATATQEKREVTVSCGHCNWKSTAKGETGRKKYARHMEEAHGAQQLPLEASTNGTTPAAAAASPPNPMPPLLPEIEAALRESIKRYGVVVPVILNRGKIIDGHNRVRISDELGINHYPVVNLDLDDPSEIAVHLNAHRRQLDAETRRSIVASLTEAGYSQRAIAGATGVSKTQVLKDQNELVTGDQLTKPKTTTGLDGKTRRRTPTQKQKAKVAEATAKADAIARNLLPTTRQLHKVWGDVSKKGLDAVTETRRMLLEMDATSTL